MNTLELETTTSVVITKAKLGDKIFRLFDEHDDGAKILEIKGAKEVQEDYKDFEFFTMDTDELVDVSDVALELTVGDSSGGWTEFYDFFGRQLYN